MINKDEALGVSALMINWLSALFNSLLLIIGGLSINQWGVVAGIVFGAITAAVNFWSKRRLVKIAEQTGQVSL